MSNTSETLHYEDDNAYKSLKKSKLGACDNCRRRKARCDCAEMPDNVCSNCIIQKVQCSHDAPRQNKTSQNQMAERQIQALEERLEKLKGYIQKCYPGEDVDSIMNDSKTTQPDSDNRLKPETGPSAQPPIANVRSSNVVVLNEEQSQISEDEDLAHVSLEDHMVKMKISTQGRFFGQSSTFMFAKHASMVRSQVQAQDNDEKEDPWRHRRPTFWRSVPWELEFQSRPKTSYVYPPNDLLMSLVSLYFERVNYIMPILHQPTFMKSLLAGLHHSHPPFGMTVLMVCAIGSRYSQDPRVIMATDASGLSAGWHYFCQVPIFRNGSLFESNTYDLQYYALGSIYLIGTSLPHVSWIFLGMGMRFALEKGIHRRKGDQKPSAESELQKRAFWAIVCLDRLGSAFVGRPYGYPHESFDTEYPIECDDAHWEADNPENAFQQPPGELSSITSFVHLIKLCDILGFTLRTLYTNKKSRVSSGFVGNDWEGRMVAELDSSMNQWKDSLPDHLRWDPENRNPLFFHQSANLHATYHYIQIQIHRPFLSRDSSLSSVSLAMCTNAARSIAHILEKIMERGLRTLPSLMVSAFTAGIFIVMGLRNGPRTEYTTWNPTKDRENLKKCLDFLRKCEHRWHCAGRLIDMLLEAAEINDVPSGSSSRHSTNFGETTSAQPDILTYPMAFTGVNRPGKSPLDDWELQQLFLRELGYPKSFPSELSQVPFESSTLQSFEDLEMYLATAGQL